MLVASCYSSPLLAKHRCLECWGPCSRRHPAGVPVGKNPWKTHFCYKGFVRILRYNSSWTWVSSFMTSTTSQPSNIYGSRVKSVLCIYIYSTPKDPLVASSVLKHLVVFSCWDLKVGKTMRINDTHHSGRGGSLFEAGFRFLAFTARWKADRFIWHLRFLLKMYSLYLRCWEWTWNLAWDQLQKTVGKPWKIFGNRLKLLGEHVHS